MTTRPLLLSVNIDHVATLRQARRAPYPDPVEAAAVAEDAGAHGITVHLRVDRRHIQDDDVRRLRPRVRGKLNLEISTAEEMLALAVETKPDQVTLVPERPEEVTTEGGLDVVKHKDTIRAAAERLASAGIDVSLFLDPDPRQLDALAALDRAAVPGFEINTDAYTKAVLADAHGGAPNGAPRGVGAGLAPARGGALDAAAELDKIHRVATDGESAGLRVYAGHGLTTANVGAIAAVPQIEELNIGHWLISRAALVGLAASVQEMLAAMSAGRGDG